MHPGDCQSHLPEGVESLRDRGGPDQVRLRAVERFDDTGSTIPQPVPIVREVARRRHHPARFRQVTDGSSGRGYQIHVRYAGHFRHDQNAPGDHQGHIVGPDLIPVS